MSEWQRQSECDDTPTEWADQPKKPGAAECAGLPSTPVPELKKPDPCPPPSCCKCPEEPSSGPNCLEGLISEKAAAIAEAEKMKLFKTDLEALLAKAKTAVQAYSRDKYDRLVKQWSDQDAQIAELIRKLDCAVKCWRCVIECHVCRFLNTMRDAEHRLCGDQPLYTEVHNLYDVLYWRQRDRDIKERRFNRIKSVLAAWEKPAQTIEKVLTDNAKLIQESGKAIGPDAPKLVFDVFLRLVPLHLAIAPPVDPDRKLQTKIRKKYTQFCECDKGEADDCCGPDAGGKSWSLLQRWIGPQPYLIDPDDYFKTICCLVEHRYAKAQEEFGKAEAAVITAENDIKRYKAVVDNGLTTFEADAKGAIPVAIDCCKLEKHGDVEQTQYRSR